MFGALSDANLTEEATTQATRRSVQLVSETIKYKATVHKNKSTF